MTAACTKTPSPKPSVDNWPERLAVFEAKRLGDDTPMNLWALRSPDAPTVYSFWATYCPPCIEEMPIFERLHVEGHRIVGVSMDAGEPALAKKTVDESGLTYPQVVLESTAMKAAGIALQAGLPFTLVIDADGRVSSEHNGKIDRARVLAAIEAAR